MHWWDNALTKSRQTDTDDQNTPWTQEAEGLKNPQILKFKMSNSFITDFPLGWEFENGHWKDFGGWNKINKKQLCKKSTLLKFKFKQ